MDLSLLQRMYDYNEWANRRTLAVARGLSGEQFGRDLGTSFRSVRGTLRHIMDVEALWLSRWGAISFPGFTKDEDVPDVAAVESRWAATAARLREFVGGLSQADLERAIAYTDTRGTARQHPLWTQLVHLVNHGTHHRGQLATLFRQLGATPQQNDFVYYHEERGR